MAIARESHTIRAIDADVGSCTFIGCSDIGDPFMSKNNKMRKFIFKNLGSNGMWMLLLTIFIFIIHYLIFINYFVDDAFISFACAKTLAEYSRFSIDRFAEIVEASSTPLWTLILAGIHFVGAPIPVGAKVLNCLFSVAIIIMVFLIGSRYGIKGSEIKPYHNTIGPFLLAVLTGFVLWSASGLENALYGFLIVGLLYGALRCEETVGILVLALFSGLISVVRPEGIIFALFIYVTILLKFYLKNQEKGKIYISFLSVIIFYLAFLYGKYSIYNWVLPNTYYAKIGDSHVMNFFNGGVYLIAFVFHYLPLILLIFIFLILIAFLGQPKSLKYIEDSCRFRLISFVLIIFSIILVILTVYYIYPRLSEIPFAFRVLFYFSNSFFICTILILIGLLIKIRSRSFVIPYNANGIEVLSKNEIVIYATSIIVANLIYVLYVGSTWGDTRFLTPTVIALSLLSQEFIKISFITSPKLLFIRKIAIRKETIITIISIAFVIQMAYNTDIAYKFPIVPAERVKENHANFGNNVGGYLISNEYLPNAKHVKFLVPDIGATAYYAENYTVIDLAMLGNVPLAHNHYERTFFEQYIFNTTKPTIIETHDDWSLLSNIESYGEFSNCYELVKGAGTDIYMGKTIPTGYFVRKDIFVSKDTIPIKISREYLGLNSYTINTKLFSPRGEMELTTYWQKSSNSEESESILNNHSLKLVLKSSEKEYTIDEHQITGGYYLPNKWNLTSVILDKRVISLDNTTEGNYTVEVQVAYPNGRIDSTKLCHITIAPTTEIKSETYKNGFYNAINSSKFNDALVALNEIRGFDLNLYKDLMNVYIIRKLDHIDSLIETHESTDAYQELYAISGNYENNTIKYHLKSTEFNLAVLLEGNGKNFEDDKMISEAIGFYEKAIWLTPDNSKLRKHIEEIRLKSEPIHHI